MKNDRSTSLKSLIALCAVAIVGCGGTMNPMPKIGVQGMHDGSPGAELVVRWEEDDPASWHKSAGNESAGKVSSRRGTVSHDTVDTDLVGTATTLREGEPAPFTGTLLDPPAAAKIAVELEMSQRRVDIEVEHATKLQAIEYELKLKENEIELDAERARRELQVGVRDAQIDDLNKQLAKEKDDPVWLWVSGGAVAGAGLTILGVFLGGR